MNTYSDQSHTSIFRKSHNKICENDSSEITNNIINPSAFFNNNVNILQNSGNIGEKDYEIDFDITQENISVLPSIPNKDFNLEVPNNSANKILTLLSQNAFTPTRRQDHKKMPIMKSLENRQNTQDEGAHSSNLWNKDSPISLHQIQQQQQQNSINRFNPNVINKGGKHGQSYSRRNLVMIQQSDIGALAQNNPNLFHSIAKLLLKDTIRRSQKVNQLAQQFVDQLLNLFKHRKPNKLRKQDYQLINDSSYILQSNDKKKKFVNFSSFKTFKIFKRLCYYLQERVFMPTQSIVIWWGFISNCFFYYFIFLYSILIFFAYEHMNDISVRCYLFLAAFFSLIDISIKLNTALFKKDSIITNRKIIIQTYLKNNFIFDFVTMFIIVSKLKDNYSQANTEQEQILYIDILGLIKIFSLIFSKPTFRQVINFKESTKYLLKLFDLIFDVIFAAHICKQKININQSILRYSPTFIYEIVSICWFSLFKIEKLYGVEQTWIEKYGIQHYTGLNRYVFSLYWAVTTMTTVGYGDITPNNTQEALFATITMILMSCIFAYSINNVGMILREIQKDKNELNSQISIMTKYLSKKNVNIELISRVRHYLIFLSEEQKERDKEQEDKILDKLSNRLREEIFVDVNQRILKLATIFKKYFSQKTINRLAKVMKEVIISPNEIIFQENSIEDPSFYFIQNGQIQLYYSSTKDSVPVKVLQSNESFGEFSFFSGLARREGAKSIGLSTLYKISRDDFISVLTKNEEDFEIFKQIQEKIVCYNNYKDLNLKCYSCDNTGHFSYECPITHYRYNKIIISLKSSYSISQKRKNHSRREKNKLLQPLTQIGENKILSRQLKELNQHDTSQLYFMFNSDNESNGDGDDSLSQEEYSNQNSKDQLDEEKQGGIQQTTRASSNMLLLEQLSSKKKSETFNINSSQLNNHFEQKNQRNVSQQIFQITIDEPQKQSEIEPESYEKNLLQESNENPESTFKNKKSISILKKKLSILRKQSTKKLSDIIQNRVSDVHKTINENQLQQLKISQQNRKKSFSGKKQSIQVVGENNEGELMNRNYDAINGENDIFGQNQFILFDQQFERMKIFKKFFVNNNADNVLKFLQEFKKQRKAVSRKKSIKTKQLNFQSNFSEYYLKKMEINPEINEIKSSVSYGIGIKSFKQKAPIRHQYN